VGPEPPHRLRLAQHAGAGACVEALGLDQGERDLALEEAVAGEVDTLLAALAEQAQQLVAAVGDLGGGRERGCRLGRKIGGERGPALIAEASPLTILCSALRAVRLNPTLLRQAGSRGHFEASS
jgi:hypothetical protein